MNHAAPQGGREEKMGIPDRHANFLDLLYRFGIDRLDFGIRRQDGTFIQRDLQSLGPEAIKKALPFLRAENVRRSDVYFRPAQQESWPEIFLDDLTHQETRGIARKYQSWIVETSPGLHHAWIRTDRPLSRAERYTELQDRLTGNRRSRIGLGRAFRTFSRIPELEAERSLGEPHLATKHRSAQTENLRLLSSPRGPAWFIGKTLLMCRNE